MSVRKVELKKSAKTKESLPKVMTEIVRMPKSGNSLVLTHAARAGDVVVSSSPFAVILDHAYSLKVCIGCGRMGNYQEEITEGPNMFADFNIRCDGCLCAAWCTHSCRSKHQAAHDSYCKFVLPLLREIRNIMISEFDNIELMYDESTRVRLLLAIICARGYESKDRQLVPFASYFGENGFEGLEANDDKWPLTSRCTELGTVLRPIFEKVLPKEFLPGPEEFIRILCQLEANTFTLWQPDYTSYGQATYIYAAKLNHSCQPNICRQLCKFGSGFELQFRAMEDLPVGQEIMFSYLPSTDPYPERQEATNTSLCFSCDCPRCSEEAVLFQSATLEFEKSDDDLVLLPPNACVCGGWLYPKPNKKRICNMCQNQEGRALLPHQMPRSHLRDDGTHSEQKTTEQSTQGAGTGAGKAAIITSASDVSQATHGEGSDDEGADEADEEDETPDYEQSLYFCRCGKWRFLEGSDNGAVIDIFVFMQCCRAGLRLVCVGCKLETVLGSD
jgi:hypothetical protein